MVNYDLRGQRGVEYHARPPSTLALRLIDPHLDSPFTARMRFAAWADRTTDALGSAFIWARGVPARLGERMWKLAYYGWIPALLLIGVATSRTPDGRRPSLAAAVLPPN